MAPEQLPQRMKFQWWRDIPRNVSRQEYDRHQLVIFGSVASGFFALGSLMMAVTGVTLKTANELAEIPPMTVAEAATATTDYELVKISGYLVGAEDNVLTMPDDESQKVLRGSLKLVVQDEVIEEDVNHSETLWEWSEGVEQIAITDNKDSEVVIDLELEQFPLPEAEPEFSERPRVKKADTEEGDRHPVAVEYGGETFELDPVKWRRADNAYTELERQALPYGQSVVIVAGLQDNQLIDPLGDRLRIELGTEEEIRRNGQQARWFTSILWLPLGGLSYYLGTIAIAQRKEFVVRSNQNS